MMILIELLDQVGVGGGILMVLSGLVGVYHLRHGLALASHIATWIQVVAVLVLIALAAMAGLIPGVDLSVQVNALWGWLSDLLGGTWAVVSSFL